MNKGAMKCNDPPKLPESERIDSIFKYAVPNFRTVSKRSNMDIKRQDHEPPLATGEWGWRYHHTGIPTTGPINGEKYLPQFKLYVGGFDTSPYGVEWMRFDANSPVDELIKNVPHIAFEVDDLDFELSKHDLKIIIKPNAPEKGIRVAMIEHNGAPIELIEFNNKNR